jgi:hypothetical protein
MENGKRKLQAWDRQLRIANKNIRKEKYLESSMDLVGLGNMLWVERGCVGDYLGNWVGFVGCVWLWLD